MTSEALRVKGYPKMTTQWETSDRVEDLTYDQCAMLEAPSTGSRWP